MKHFGANLAFLRKSRRMKQAEIQAGLGIQRTTWNNYENGKSFPNLQLFVEIAKYFGVNETDLLHNDISLGKVSEVEANTKKGKVLGKVLGKEKPKKPKKGFVEDLIEFLELKKLYNHQETEWFKLKAGISSLNETERQELARIMVETMSKIKNAEEKLIELDYFQDGDTRAIE